jgi:hypothetical protein
MSEEKRTSRSRQSKSEFDRAPFDRHLLGSLPTLIFHLAAVEAHGAFMVAVPNFVKKVAVRLFVVMVCTENTEGRGVGG